MLGPRTFSEGSSELFHKPPTHQLPAGDIKKKRTATLRKKINSVKSFFHDKQKRHKLSRNASMPDIHAAMDSFNFTLNNNPERKYSDGSIYNPVSEVVLRDKSRLSTKRNFGRPMSECLQFIDENASFTPRHSWMNTDDGSPGSTISMKSERHYRPTLSIDEESLFPPLQRLSSSNSSNLEQTSLMDSLDSLLSYSSIDSVLTDENHNEVNNKLLRSKSAEFHLPSNINSTNNKINARNIDPANKSIALNTRHHLNTNTNEQSVDDLGRNIPVRKSKSFQHQKKKETFPDLFSNIHNNKSAEAEDIRQQKAAPSLEHHHLKFLMEFEARRVLSDFSYDSKSAAKWSKDISGNIRERLRDHTRRNYKIVVNTFIGSIATNQHPPNGVIPQSEHVHMASRSVTDPATDRFIMAAMQNNDLFVAMTLLLLKY